MTIEKSKGGRWQELSRQHKRRFKGDKKLCYGCNTYRKEKEYYSSSTRCKYCMLKLNRARSKKKNKPLW